MRKHHPDEDYRPKHGPRHHGMGHERGGGPEGRGGRARRGEVRTVLLDALRDGAKHGYEIIKVLEERSGGDYSPSPGTIYPTLQYLEELGFISARQQADRRMYELTESGRAQLEERAEEVEAFWMRFQQCEFSPVLHSELGFLKEEMLYLEQTVRRLAREAAASENIETVRRIRTTIEQCRNEVRRIAVEPGK